MKDVSKGNSKETFRPVVGIDLGTTNSTVAVISQGKPHIIPAPNGEKLIPSVVLINTEGKVIVGRDAVASLVAMPSRTIAEVKREMGSSEGINIAGKKLLPQEISSFIIKELKGYVDNYFGEGEKEAVITVPAHFTDEQRRATKQAGELAGFVVERIINEPTAAAMAFGIENLREDGHVLVYDLGGGTFDVSVIEMMDGILEVKSSAGNNHLGGGDFDLKIVDWFAEKMIAKHRVDPRKDIRARALLKEEAERVKILLSTEESVAVSLPIVTVEKNKPFGLEVVLRRDEFIEFIDEMLLETMGCVKSALEEASLIEADIDEILLVGGSTHIPRVFELIKNMFNKQPRRDINPDEAVALGAAVQAGLKSGALSESGLIVTDVAPYSMGVAVLQGWPGFAGRPGGFCALIPKNTTIPVTKSEKFCTASDNQTVVEIEIFQGENEWTKNNHHLGDFLLEGLPPNQAGVEEVEVTFRYNINGILEVSARSVSTEQEMKITVNDALERDSKESYSDSVKKLEDFLRDAASSSAESEEKEWEEFQKMLQSRFAEEAEDEPDEEMTLEELREEAIRLKERAKALLRTSKGKRRWKIKSAIKLLEKSMKKTDLGKMQEVLDQVTDKLIELEL